MRGQSNFLMRHRAVCFYGATYLLVMVWAFRTWSQGQECNRMIEGCSGFVMAAVVFCVGIIGALALAMRVVWRGRR